MAANDELHRTVGRLEAAVESLKDRIDGLEDQLQWVMDLEPETGEQQNFVSDMIGAMKMLKDAAPALNAAAREMGSEMAKEADALPAAQPTETAEAAHKQQTV